jgi:hypothetical protein
MRIQVSFAALRTIKPHEYAVRFFFGGAITLAAGLIAKRFGAAVGGLFLAFPAIFPASVTLLSKHEQEKKEKAELKGTERAKLAAALDARGATLGAAGLMSFAAIVLWTLRSWPTAATLCAATGCWFACSFALLLLERKV